MQAAHSHCSTRPGQRVCSRSLRCVCSGPQGHPLFSLLKSFVRCRFLLYRHDRHVPQPYSVGITLERGCAWLIWNITELVAVDTIFLACL